MQKDLETLIFRIEELELDNERMAVKLNTSVNRSNSEDELKRKVRETEQEVVSSLIDDISLIFDVKPDKVALRDPPQALREVMSQVRTKLAALKEKLEALEESKDL
jgi:hypothetical protein